MAGGIGSRFWPFSRNDKPKQFLDFFGTGRSLLQMTVDRFRSVVPIENVLIVTNVIYKDLVLEQIPELRENQVLCEPARRNTAPCIAYAVARIYSETDKANIIVTPSDHLILQEEAFRQSLQTGLEFIENNNVLLTLGMKPTRPETGYGYIQMGCRVAGGMYRVKSFSEKPETDYAEAFVESGEFLWNTGLFLWNERTMWQTLHERFHAIEVPDRSQGRGAQFTEEEEAVFINENFPAELPRSIDLCVLERCTNVVVQTCTFGWCDIGNWTDLYQAGRKDADSNVVTGEGQAMLSGCRKNIVRLPAGKTAVINGLENYVVVQDGDVLLICPNDPALMRRLVTEARVQLGE